MLFGLSASKPIRSKPFLLRKVSSLKYSTIVTENWLIECFKWAGWKIQALHLWETISLVRWNSTVLPERLCINPTQRLLPGKTSSYHSTLYTSVGIKSWGYLQICVECCSVHKSGGKQAGCASTDECIMKIWYKYTVEIYPTIRKIEIFRKIDGPKEYIMQDNPHS